MDPSHYAHRSMRSRAYATYADPADSVYLRARLDELGWEPAADGEWNLHWSNAVQPLRMFRALHDGQRISHFPGIGPLVYKDELYHNLVRARRRVGGGGWYDFFPRTYSMPEELPAWRAAVTADPGKMWIRKRKWSANGDGVAMVTALDDVPISTEWLVQQYVANPLLFPDQPFRHVLRVYALVTSLDPLVVYLHRNGVATFSSREYTTDPEARADPIVHITSAPIQRMNSDVDDPIRSIDLVEYRRLLEQIGADFDAIWADIRRLALQTVLAHRGPVLRLSRELTPRLDCCFELLGFDLVIDDELAVWLLEVNQGPGIGPTAAAGPSQDAQRRTKSAVVRDLLDVIGAAEPGWDVGLGPERFAAEYERRGRFDRIFPARDSGRYLRCLEGVTPADEVLLGAGC